MAQVSVNITNMDVTAIHQVYEMCAKDAEVSHLSFYLKNMYACSHEVYFKYANTICAQHNILVNINILV